MAMTNAEKIRALRERMKAQGLTQRSVYLPKGEPTPTQEALASFLAWQKGQLQATAPAPSTAPDAEAERKEAKRKEGRRLARLADHSRANGRITGLCEAALQEDKRTRSMTLETLDKGNAWEPLKTPPGIR
jgi:hypothetical protein